jgi:hypothetical protein
MAKYYLKLDDRKIAIVAQGTADRCARKAAFRARDRARANLVTSGRMDTGALHRSLTVTKVPLTSVPAKVSYSVGSPLKYAVYQERGTRTPIVPRRAKFLRFKPKGSQVFIFRRWVRGIAGVHFLRRAAEATTVKDFV